MFKNIIILTAAAAIVALPFILRPAPEKGEWKEGDPVLVVVSPHIASIREEFARGFSEWHNERYGVPVSIDWRNIGGTTEIMRYLESEYDTAFAAYLHRSAGDANASTNFFEIDDPAAFTCKIDVFFGGGTYDHGAAAKKGLTVAPWPKGEWPKGVIEDGNGNCLIPEGMGGEVWRTDVFCSAVLSGFGIASNPDRLVDLGITNADGSVKQPSTWRDLTDPRLCGLVAVTDPTKSGSIAKAFEMILHSTCRDYVIAKGWSPDRISEMEKNGPKPGDAEWDRYQAAVEAGWLEGIHLLQRVGANARYFTDAAGKVPVDVAAGDAAAGVCIDFYGRVQAETTRSGDRERLLYVTPRGGSSISGDPVSLLRGSEHRELACRFIEYILSEDGQKLWNGKPGVPGGPRKHALRRLPIRKSFYDGSLDAPGYETSDPLRDPSVDAYLLASSFEYEPRWTAAHFSFLRSFVRAMCMDSGEELRAAWRAILAAGGPEACPEAVRLLERMPEEPYAVNWANVTAARKDASLLKGLSSTDLQTEWTIFFRNSYNEARAAAEKR